MNTSDFEKELQQVRLAETADESDISLFSARLIESWLQGRTGFGGLQAALACCALRQSVESQRPLRSLLTSFIGPSQEGELIIACDELRRGKSATWAEAKILQEGNLCSTFQGCFGEERVSEIQVSAKALPTQLSAEESKLLPFIPGVTPNFIQHFDLRWAFGDVPFSGSSQSEMGAWVRFKEISEISEFHLIAMMDLLPPAVLPMFKSVRPISSLTWQLQLLDNSLELSKTDIKTDDWWFFHVFALAAGHGYSQQQATLYSPHGQAVAISQQSVAVFDQ
ncbi:MAG: thioesterase family protein [Pseudomonadota bacterium]